MSPSRSKRRLRTTAIPVLVSAATSTNGLTVEMTFNIAMADPSGKHAQFACSGKSISGVALKGGNSKIIVATVTVAYVNGNTVTCGYTKGTVTSSLSGALESFATQPVTNQVP